jgi:hypothetical protein
MGGGNPQAVHVGGADVSMATISADARYRIQVSGLTPDPGFSETPNGQRST